MAAAPTAAAAATVAPTDAAAATPVSFQRVAYPEKGKPITIIVPFDAGGAVDVSGRLLAAEMEKELGVPVQVVNKPGAATQVGMTALVQSKPDGYTLAYTGSTYMNVYLDPERKAVYDAKSFQPVANYAFDAIVLVVKADSPFKSPKDVIDAAKANPEKVKFGTTGIAGAPHMAAVLLEMATGAKFAFVHFSGGAPSSAALLGGNVDVGAGTVPEYLPTVKIGPDSRPGRSGQGGERLLSGREDPGGSSDTIMRLMSPILEKELGVPIQIVNKEGAGSQVGSTEIALSKPDGYTFGYTSVPTINTIYLDPERKAAFGRKDLQALSMHDIDYNVLAVKADSPFKTVKDLVDAAKANPGKITVTSAGLMSTTHLAILQFEQAAGIDVSIVHFNGQGPATTALLGGHVDVTAGYVGTLASTIKAGSIRVIGIMGPEENKFAPGVQTLEAMGIKGVAVPNIRGFIMPAGAPQEVIDTLASALRKATEDPQHVKQMEDVYYTVRYAGPKEFGAIIDEWDTKGKPLIELAKKEAAQ